MSLINKIKTFFKEVYVELRKVSWLSRSEVLRYTIIILFISVITAAFLGGLDYLFSSLIQKFILK